MSNDLTIISRETIAQDEMETVNLLLMHHAISRYIYVQVQFVDVPYIYPAYKSVTLWIFHGPVNFCNLVIAEENK